MLDTCVLLELLQSDSPFRQQVHKTVEQVESGGKAACCIAEPCLAEVWNVLTRPPIMNGFGYASHKARNLIDALVDQYPLLEMRHDHTPSWLDVASGYGLTGQHVRHARLVSTMMAHGVSQLIRVSDEEFPEIGGIRVLQVGMALV
ncbi:MAG: PIN domain-containing protein [Rhodothermales bacterium]